MQTKEKMGKRSTKDFRERCNEVEAIGWPPYRERKMVGVGETDEENDKSLAIHSTAIKDNISNVFFKFRSTSDLSLKRRFDRFLDVCIIVDFNFQSQNET